MITNGEYQRIIELKFGKPLKDIMYELCVKKDVVPTEGASILEVPKSTFISWRNKYRFGIVQRRVDNAQRFRKEQIERFKENLNEVDLTRPFMFRELDQSIIGFKELVERNLELWKMESVQVGGDTSKREILITYQINALEQSLSLINKYINGDAQKEYLAQAKRATM